MSDAHRPTLVLLAGPNGAGKTTLYETRVKPSLAVPFINADIIQREELKTGAMNAAYEAARIADDRRRDHTQNRKSFATETVFSHPSKLDLIKDAKTAGYRVMLFHVGLRHSDLSVARVSERVKEGGHPVPEDKIRARFDRNGPLIRKAALLCDIAHVFDNSALNKPPRRALTLSSGRLSFAVPDMPDWVLDIYQDDLAV